MWRTTIAPPWTLNPQTNIKNTTQFSNAVSMMVVSCMTRLSTSSNHLVFSPPPRFQHPRHPPPPILQLLVILSLVLGSSNQVPVSSTISRSTRSQGLRLTTSNPPNTATSQTIITSIRRPSLLQTPPQSKRVTS